MSRGGNAPSSSARLSRLYVTSDASIDLRATSRFPRASTTDQYCPTACRTLLFTSAAKLARDCSRLRRAITSGARLANSHPFLSSGCGNWKFRNELIEGLKLLNELLG